MNYIMKQTDNNCAIDVSTCGFSGYCGKAGSWLVKMPVLKGCHTSLVMDELHRAHFSSYCRDSILTWDCMVCVVTYHLNFHVIKYHLQRLCIVAPKCLKWQWLYKECMWNCAIFQKVSANNKEIERTAVLIVSNPRISSRMLRQGGSQHSKCWSD